MIFKNWAVIIILAAIGLGLWWYWLSIPTAAKGVVALSLIHISEPTRPY